MVTKARTIQVTAGSELARLLDDPAGLPVELVKDGVRYRLLRLDEATDVESGYGPEAAESIADSEEGRRWLDHIVGAWADIDADRLIEELRRAREEGTMPADRRRPLA